MELHRSVTSPLPLGILKMCRFHSQLFIFVHLRYFSGSGVSQWAYLYVKASRATCMLVLPILSNFLTFKQSSPFGFGPACDRHLYCIRYGPEHDCTRLSSETEAINRAKLERGNYKGNCPLYLGNQ